jgi:hypothetical protein
MDTKQIGLLLQKAFGSEFDLPMIKGALICVELEKQCSITSLISATGPTTDDHFPNLLMAVFDPVIFEIEYDSKKATIADIARFERTHGGPELAGLVYGKTHTYKISGARYDMAKEMWHAQAMITPDYDFRLCYDIYIAREVHKVTGDELPILATISEDLIVPPPFIKKEFLIKLVK